MSIAWNYLDKRSAAMAALKDYRSMKAILATTRDALRGVGAWCAKSAGGRKPDSAWNCGN